MQEQEYRQRQFAEIGRTASEDSTEGLQAQGEVAGSSMMDAANLVGRQGTLGSGYFDAAGNWQTYDMDAIAEEPDDLNAMVAEAPSQS